MQREISENHLRRRFGGETEIKMTTLGRKLPTEFYKTDALSLARALLGKVLVSCRDGKLTAVIISDTEAYMGKSDRACHAYGGHRSPSNESMYLTGGHAYVYLIYGMYHCMNVTANEENIPEAVLIRGALPFFGIDTMLSRRSLPGRTPSTSLRRHLADGPGKLCRAMAVDKSADSLRLDGDELYICDADLAPTGDIAASARLNIDYAGEDALRPWRFTLSSDDPLRRYAAAL